MKAVVLDEAGRALVFDRVTGEVSRHSVPTAIENVKLGGGRYVHGTSGEPMKVAEKAPADDEPAIPLQEEDVLSLPAPDPEAPAAEEPETGTDEPAEDAYPHLSPAQEAALDQDGDQKPGGAPRGGNRRRAGAKK